MGPFSCLRVVFSGRIGRYACVRVLLVGVQIESDVFWFSVARFSNDDAVREFNFYPIKPVSIQVPREIFLAIRAAEEDAVRNVGKATAHDCCCNFHFRFLLSLFSVFAFPSLDCIVVCVVSSIYPVFCVLGPPHHSHGPVCKFLVFVENRRENPFHTSFYPQHLGPGNLFFCTFQCGQLAFSGPFRAEFGLFFLCPAFKDKLPFRGDNVVIRHFSFPPCLSSSLNCPYYTTFFRTMQWAYYLNIRTFSVQHDETKAPAGFLQRAGGGCLSIGGEKVFIKYHIPSVETRPILGAGFFVGQKLSIN
nr:MAG TPA: hypothetical protein [Caudoviricetes sp.]